MTDWKLPKPMLGCRVGIHQWEGNDLARRCAHCQKLQLKRPNDRWRTKIMYSACYCIECGNELSGDPLTSCEMVTEYVFAYECRCSHVSTFEYGIVPCALKVEYHG